MNTKVLWNIQSLWEKFFSQEKSDNHLSKRIKEQFFSSGSDSGFSLVSSFSFHKSKEPIFSDDHGKYLGLATSQVIESKGKLIYLCDNHNKVLVPMYHLYSVLQKPIDIIHIDAHRDDALFPKEKPSEFNLENLTSLLEETRISDFFDSLSETKVVGSLDRFTDSPSFLNDEVQKSHLLSLDIDIFGEEGAFVDTEEKVKTIASTWKQADVICIATSPGFINQDYAQKIIEIFTKT